MMRVDFALVLFRGAEVMGSLKEGRIRLTPPDGSSLDVYNASFGSGMEKVTGGPWQVWGRWQAPNLSTDEAVSNALAMLEQKRAAGIPMLGTPAGREINERVCKGKPMMNHGGSGIAKSERMEIKQLEADGWSAVAAAERVRCRNSIIQSSDRVTPAPARRHQFALGLFDHPTASAWSLRWTDSFMPDESRDNSKALRSCRDRFWLTIG